MSLIRHGRFVFIACFLSFLIASCGSDDSAEPRLRLVPAEYPTIKEAVTSAEPGDIIEVAAGEYSESVTVEKDNLIIRGVDRNSVVLNGNHKLPNGILVSANGVSIQNLTVHSYTQNGIVFNGIQGATRGKNIDPKVVYGADGNWIDGYHVTHVTSYNNGLYGVYAFASTNGIIEDSYVSGHPDSGIYIGQCSPCNALVRRVVADTNAIGYYGTNASGNVFVINSTFSNNRIGIAPNSQKAEKLAPQRETFVVGNRVINNDNPQAPQVPDGAFGLGIAVGGGTKNDVLRNLVVGHDVAGISVMTLGEFAPENNRVEANVTRDNNIDLAYSVGEDGKVRGNCFAKNKFAQSLPLNIETVLGCVGSASTIAPVSLAPYKAPPAIDYKKIPAPKNQTILTTRELKSLEAIPQFAVPDISEISVPS